MAADVDARPTPKDFADALAILGGVRYRHLEMGASVAQALRDQQELACQAVCAMCQGGVPLEYGFAGWRHFDGDAFYRCAASTIRQVLAGRMLAEEAHR